MKTHENAESKINMADNFSLQQKEISTILKSS
jgi:hypothetical protein